jgi:putative membrane protein
MPPTPPKRDWLTETRHVLIRWLISSLAIFVAVWIVPGITFAGPGWQLGIVAAILGLLGTLVRPILVLLSLPVIACTFGLFMLVINAAMLALASAVADRIGIAFHVDDFGAAVLGGLVISLVSTILTVLAGENRVYIHVHRGDQ